MCESFSNGAKSQNIETEIINLYDIDFKGCRSCFACKLKNGKNFGKCSYPDGITELLEKISMSDGLVLASPIYFGDITSSMRAFVERLMFPFFQYDNNGTTIAPKRLKTAIIYTMNVDRDYFFRDYLGSEKSDTLKNFEKFLGYVFNAPDIIYAFDTYQFSDYDKYLCERFDKIKKQKQREEQFPKDLEKAFESGVKMAKEIK